jgi:hypothetical protein
MQAVKHRPIEAACAWTGAELRNQTDWIRPFAASELAEIDAAVRAVQRRGLDWVDVGRDDFPLPTFAGEIAKIAQELETGRGMIMLRGLPQTYTPEELRLAYWGIGAHIGTAVSQGGTGELLGLVEDEGKAVDVTKRRGSKNSLELDFHADRCDVVGLLCVRKSKAGGVSRVVSATAIHNEILRRRPDLIDVFYADWYHSRQGDERPGEARAYPKPFFGFRDGYFTGLVSPLYIRSAQKFPGAGSRRNQEALELYATLSNELCTRHVVQTGRHSAGEQSPHHSSERASEDYPEPERKRLLLRLWLSVPGVARCRRATSWYSAGSAPVKFEAE